MNNITPKTFFHSSNKESFNAITETETETETETSFRVSLDESTSSNINFLKNNRFNVIETNSDLVNRKINDISKEYNFILWNAIRDPAEKKALKKMYTYIFSDKNQKFIFDGVQARTKFFHKEKTRLKNALDDKFPNLPSNFRKVVINEINHLYKEKNYNKASYLQEFRRNFPEISSKKFKKIRKFIAEWVKNHKLAIYLEERHLGTELREKFPQFARHEINDFIFTLTEEFTSNFEEFTYDQIANFLGTQTISNNTSSLSIFERRLRDQILRPLEEDFIKLSFNFSNNEIDLFMTESFEALAAQLSQHDLDKFLEDDIFRTIKLLLLPLLRKRERSTRLVTETKKIMPTKKHKRILLDGQELLSILEEESYQFSEEKALRLFKNGFPDLLFKYTGKCPKFFEKEFIRALSKRSDIDLINTICGAPFDITPLDKQVMLRHLHNTWHPKKNNINFTNLEIKNDLIYRFIRGYTPTFGFDAFIKKIKAQEIQTLYLKAMAYSNKSNRIISIKLEPTKYHISNGHSYIQKFYYPNLTWLKHFHSLTHLDLSQRPDLTRRHTSEMISLKFLSKLTTLESLQVDYCTFISDKEIIHIAKRLKKLQFLSLEGCSQTSKKSLNTLKSLKNLEVLNVKKIKKLGNYDFIKKIISLETIHLSVYRNISYKKSKIKENFNHCTSIHISGPSSQKEILDSFSELENLTKLKWNDKRVEICGNIYDNSDITMSTDSENYDNIDIQIMNSENISEEYCDNSDITMSTDSENYDNIDIQIMNSENTSEEYDDQSNMQIKDAKFETDYPSENSEDIFEENESFSNLYSELNEIDINTFWKKSTKNMSIEKKIIIKKKKKYLKNLLEIAKRLQFLNAIKALNSERNLENSTASDEI